MRGKKAKKRTLLPDAVYKSTVVSRFINYTMISGKKSVAREIVYKALEKLGQDQKIKPLEAFTKALDNLKPKLEVRSRRVGGANYQIPVPVSADRQEALAMRWIISAARESRKKTEIWESLANELNSAIKKEGVAYKKKEDTQKMAEANKAFSHFSW